MSDTKRPGQHDGESTMEYLRRAVHGLNYEPEGVLDQLPGVDALLDYFDLWHTYGTDFWSGVLECIEAGEDPQAARDFVAKYALQAPWNMDIEDAIAAREEAAADDGVCPACGADHEADEREEAGS